MKSYDGGRVTFARLRDAAPNGLRIAFVTNMWPDDVRPFYGSFIRSQAVSLVEIGIGVDVFYIRGFESVSAYASSARRLPRWITPERYDAVHVHYGHTAASSLGVTRVPKVISFCGEDLLGAPRENRDTAKSRLEVSVFRQLSRTAAATITKSEEMALVLPADQRAKNTVLPNGVDLDRFKPRSKLDARQRLGWDLDKQIMLFLGNPDDPRKNVALARAAAERVQRVNPAAELKIAWGVPVDDVPTFFNAADCLVFPSKSEGSPNAVKEAMASALPVVATPVGDIPERFRGVQGCYERPATVEAFADGLAQALPFGLATDARQAVSRISVGAIAERLRTLYLSVAQ